MSIYPECEARLDVPCYSPIGLREVAFVTTDGYSIGPIWTCATHYRWLGVQVVKEWIDPLRVRVLSEEEQLAIRDEQDIEDIVDSDGRLLPRGLR